MTRFPLILNSLAQIVQIKSLIRFSVGNSLAEISIFFLFFKLSVFFFLLSVHTASQMDSNDQLKPA